MSAEREEQAKAIRALNAELDAAVEKATALKQILTSLPTPDDVSELSSALPSQESIEEVIKAFDKLPDLDVLQEYARALPSSEQIEGVREALDKLPSPDDLCEYSEALPSNEQIEDVRQALSNLPSSDDIQRLTDALPPVEEIESRRLALAELLRLAHALQRIGQRRKFGQRPKQKREGRVARKASQQSGR